MKTIAKRLKEFFEEQGISIASVEQRIGLSNDSLGKALRNDKNFNAEILPKIIEAYGVNPVWVLMGKGSAANYEIVGFDTKAAEGQHDGKQLGDLKKKIEALERTEIDLRYTIKLQEELLDKYRKPPNVQFEAV